MKESDLQRAVASFLNEQEKRRKTFTWFHTPNSIRTNKTQAYAHKAYGMRAGVPDCMIFGKGKTIAIELKMPRNYLTPEQKLFHERLKNLDYPVYVVKSHNADGAVKQVEQILKHEGVL